MNFAHIERPDYGGFAGSRYRDFFVERGLLGVPFDPGVSRGGVPSKFRVVVRTASGVEVTDRRPAPGRLGEVVILDVPHPACENPCMDANSRSRVFIVGGGFAGLEAAKALGGGPGVEPHANHRPKRS